MHGNFLMGKRYSTILLTPLLLLVSTGAVADLQERLQAASAIDGKNIFMQCAACHTVDKNGAAGLGPNLYGIINAPVARHSDFDYSPALEEYGGSWSLDRLDEFLENPMDTVPGTKMLFQGIEDPSARAHVIAYLNTLSDEPIDSIGSKLSATELQMPATMQVGSLFHAPGAEKTYYSCTTCHSEMIVAQQGLTREEWDKMLVWMVEEQGMNPLEESDRNEILDYLGAHYNVDRPNFPR